MTSDGHRAVEIKGSMFTLPVLRLYSADVQEIGEMLSEHLAKHLAFFENAPVVIDLEHVKDEDGLLDLSVLATLLRCHQLVPVGIRQGSDVQNAAALAAGLAVLKGGAIPAAASKKPAEAAPKSEVPVLAQAQAVARPTRVIRQPVRSGQQIYAQGGDLIVMAQVNAGAEVIADGNIHIYAPLRGRAMAGVLGDVNARIFTQSMEAELLAIAGNYQVYEESQPASMRGKAVQVYLEGTQLLISPLS
ncbi:MAG: septum site-determining protein MinC [Pseudomonadota bacterium]|nr:septum site-determining protein MinC [Pseudomonadota bacterium]